MNISSSKLPSANLFKLGILFYSIIGKLTLFFAIVSLLISISSDTAFSQPNIVLIMADDLGYYDVGFNRIHRPDIQDYGIIPTPNIDRIAQSGATCTRGYTAHPFCGPSRAALLTGRYPHEVGSQYNIKNGGEDCNGQNVGIPIGPDSEFFSSILQQQGNYLTYMIGKWHMGNAQQYDPLSRGFTEYYGFLGGGHQYFPEGDASQGINSSNAIAANQNNTGINDYFTYLEKNRQWLTNESRYVTRAISEEAVNFIKQGKQSSQSFLTYVAYNAPHTPLQAPLPDINQFKIDNPNFESNLQNSPDILNAKKVVEAATPAEKQAEIDKLIKARIIYATMVTIMDEGIGKILDELQSSSNGGSVFNNTIVIFLSDNGGKLREAGAVNFPLERGKGAVNEGGFRVPFCVSWPGGGIQANTTYDYPVSSLDIYPSMLAAANLAIPNRLDGENVLQNIANVSATLRNDPLYILRHYNGFSNVSIFDNIPGSNNKLIKKANGTWKQYDVDTDIGEANDINNATTTELINRLVPKVRLLAEQHIQPLFFDNCGNVLTNWIDKNMPRFKDGSNRAAADTPDETFFLDCLGALQDSDNDGVCDGLDLCAGNDDTIDANANGIPDACDVCVVGSSCNDNNVCTTGDVYDVNCNCTGSFADADNDRVCDTNDVCAGGDDTVDSDNDGIPNFCDNCNNNLINTTCNDGDSCTTNDRYNASCDCIGLFADADNDGVCDTNDVCAGGDDTVDSDNDGIPNFCDNCNNNLINTTCNDGDACTTNDRYNASCDCIGSFTDADNDGVCDTNDICPGGNDNIDNNMDGTPDYCYVCPTVINNISMPVIMFDREANISISTNGKVPTNADVQYHAGQEIELMNSFEVELNADFFVFIEGCQ